MQIGNAVINEETDSDGLYDYLASHAIISDKAAYLNKACQSSSSKIQESVCDAAGDEVGDDIEYIDLYNIYAPLCKNANLTSLPKRNSVRFKYLAGLIDFRKLNIAWSMNFTRIDAMFICFADCDWSM